MPRPPGRRDLDPDEREMLLAIVERGQRQFGRAVSSSELLSVVRTDELYFLPDSSRQLTSWLDRHAYAAGMFGRTLRRHRRGGTMFWSVWIQDDHLRWASEAKLLEQVAAIQAELARRLREEAPAQSVASPTQALPGGSSNAI